MHEIHQGKRDGKISKRNQQVGDGVNPDEIRPPE
jgi:hypothetical protein